MFLVLRKSFRRINKFVVLAVCLLACVLIFTTGRERGKGAILGSNLVDIANVTRPSSRIQVYKDIIRILPTSASTPASSVHGKLGHEQLNTSADLTGFSGVPYPFNTTGWIHTVTYFLPPPKSLCSPTPRLILLIISAPDNFRERRAIRETWGRDKEVVPSGQKSPVIVSYGFVLGRNYNNKTQQKISLEHQQHQDMIQGDYTDTYRNLTTKSVLSLKFASEFCANSSFLLKVDDDVFLNMEQLTRIAPWGAKRTITGVMIRNSPVLRDGKWAVSEQEYNTTMYPNYISGPTYFITMDTLPELFDLAMRTEFFVMEDVFITGLLALKLNITRLHTFSDMYDTYMNNELWRSCYLKYVAGYHQVTFKQQYLMWHYLQIAKNMDTFACPFNKQ